jgi:hypothetical protein
MDKFRLKLFFLELLELSYQDIRPGWGNPCSQLLNKMIMYQDPFLDKIIGDYTNNSNELRLNGAGLKMYWEVDKETRQFKCSISGDQAKEYPMFVARARQVIKQYGFNKR